MHLVGSMVRTHKLPEKLCLGQFASTGLAILAGRPFQLRSKTVTVFFSLILLKHLAAIVDTVEHKLHYQILLFVAAPLMSESFVSPCLVNHGVGNWNITTLNSVLNRGRLSNRHSHGISLKKLIALLYY